MPKSDLKRFSPKFDYMGLIKEVPTLKKLSETLEAAGQSYPMCTLEADGMVYVLLETKHTSILILTIDIKNKHECVDINFSGLALDQEKLIKTIEALEIL